MSEFVSYIIHTDLHTLNDPTLLSYGDLDPVAILSGKRLLTAICNSKITVIKNAGVFWL